MDEKDFVGVMAVCVLQFFLVLSVSMTNSFSNAQSVRDPCHHSVTHPGEGHIIGKRSAEDPGTPHGKVINCTTSVPSSIAKSTDVASHTIPVHSPVEYTGSQTISLATATLPTLQVYEKTAILASSERSSDTTVHDVSRSSMGAKETRTVQMKTSFGQSQTTEATVTSSLGTQLTTRKTTISSAPPTTRKTTGLLHTLTSSKHSTVTTRLTTIQVAVSSKDTSDSFDHELAIIFGSMLGIMVLGLFCFGVFRCYGREKTEFMKTQNNYSNKL
ncbi:uncharacterized protein LOC134232126 [Saccostrea cucullata]|uniref:uncharacterized protein LOC134232126 n=1 Tax=Saccostrea cuccullata TaxID=36930 RepID=UPI002ED027B1